MKRGPLWLRLLLRVFPRAFRERHEDDMLQAFEQAHDEHRARGRRSATAFVARTTVDLLVSGARERARGWLQLASLLDLKLGVRMLFKHPGLTVASLFALSVGIPVGLAPAHLVDGLLAPLPVPDGQDIRALRLWSPALGHADDLTYLDYEAWRDELSSFESLGAFRESTYNVNPRDGVRSRVWGAQLSASVFDVLRVRPHLGRVFSEADENPGGEPVVVIGHELWTSRFNSDPAIVGRTVRLGDVAHTVVGVMPDGFLFPERQNLWTPLREGAVGRPEQSARVAIFGRLAEGVDDEAARAELSVVAGRVFLPTRDERVEAQVEPFAHTVLPGLNGGLRGTPEYLGFQSFALFVLLVACANVGMLIFARTATRGSELAVRTALGASRGRIVAQVFTESLVLALLAAGVGLLLMELVFDVGLSLLPVSITMALPYWIDWDVSARTAMYALALAGVSAAVAGALPALRFTGKSVQANIQRARANRTGMRFGGISSVLIVLDVAVSVAAIGFAVTVTDMVRQTAGSPPDVGIPAEEYLAVSVTLPATVRNGDEDEHRTRMAYLQEEMVRRVEAEPGIGAVAVANRLPREEHSIRLVEAEGVVPPDGRRGLGSRTARIDVDFFEKLNQPILAGRGFDAGDLGEHRTTVIVNTTFAERVFGAQNPLGRRIRFLPWGDGEPGPWKEIVGVVGSLGMRTVSELEDQGVYEPVAPGELGLARFAIHVGEDPAGFAPRVRSLVAEIDGEAIVGVSGRLSDVYEADWYILIAVSVGMSLLAAVLLTLATSGIYAIMSFSVSERMREISVRTALGARQADVVRSVVKRAMIQLAVGVTIGMPIALDLLNGDEAPVLQGAGTTLAAGIGVMVFVGLAACTGPTLRALRVQPSEVLRGDT